MRYTTSPKGRANTPCSSRSLVTWWDRGSCALVHGVRVRGRHGAALHKPRAQGRGTGCELKGRRDDAEVMAY